MLVSILDYAIVTVSIIIYNTVHAESYLIGRLIPFDITKKIHRNSLEILKLPSFKIIQE